MPAQPALLFGLMHYKSATRQPTERRPTCKFQDVMNLLTVVNDNKKNRLFAFRLSHGCISPIECLFGCRFCGVSVLFFASDSGLVSPAEVQNISLQYQHLSHIMSLITIVRFTRWKEKNQKITELQICGASFKKSFIQIYLSFSFGYWPTIARLSV